MDKQDPFKKQPRKTRARAVWHMYGLYYRPKGSHPRWMGAAPSAGRKWKTRRAFTGKRNDQKAVSKSICIP